MTRVLALYRVLHSMFASSNAPAECVHKAGIEATHLFGLFVVFIFSTTPNLLGHVSEKKEKEEEEIHL